MARGNRHKVGTVDDLPTNGTRIIAEIEGQEIAVFRYEDEFYALANYCVHQAGPLCEGRLTGKMKLGDDGWDWEYEDNEKCIVCPWHGWKFDITTGDNIDDDHYSTPTYDVETDDGDIYIIR
jgi:nitrite reductase/ring-hydroxylating ferredoxin subunit